MSTYAQTLKKAAKWASREFNRKITVEDLRTICKSPRNVRPRQFAMAYMYATGRFSMPQVAKALSLKDHNAVLHGLRRAHGHDGKLLHKYEPLWNKEHFEYIVKLDGSSHRLPPQAFERVNAEQILSIGLMNLARYRYQISEIRELAA